MTSDCPQSVGYVRFAIDGFAFGQQGDPGKRQDPNPRSIRWSQENTIVTAQIPGHRNKTQCTDPGGGGLWRLDVRLRTLTREARDFLKALTPGPHVVQTSLMTLCMYLVSKVAEQVEGEDDLTWSWSLSFLEAND